MTKRRCRPDAISKSYRGLSIVILVGALLGGCASLPDTGGYTVATIQVKEAVETTGEVVKTEMKSARSAGATTANEQSVKGFEAAWNATMTSLDAMVEYAQSIEQIVDAGNKGAESARQVGDSVKRLVDEIKVDAVTGAGAEVVQLSIDTVAFVYGEYAKHSAAKSLEEALDAFGPSMQRISALVQAQVEDAQRLFVEQIAAQVAELESGSGYGDWIKRKAELSAKQQTAMQQLIAVTPPPASADPAKVAEVKTTLAQLEIAQKQIAPHLVEYNEKLKAIRQREKAGLSILEATENAIAAWGVTYQELAQAVKERRPVNVDSLIAAVAEARTLSQRWREL
jgi:predicted nucleic acid-binding protein